MALYSAPARPGRRRFWARRAQVSADPFETLALQVRLGVVADLLRTIECDERMFARGQRWIATRLAYDALLGDACGLAGDAFHQPPSPDQRLEAELELASRGWSW